MTTLAELAEALDEQIPFAAAAEWDRVGVQFGVLEAQCGLIGVCHEVNELVMAAAAERGIKTLVSYHPLLFTPAVSLVSGSSAHGRTYRLIRDGVGLISLHTAFDVVVGGASDQLAAALGLSEPVPFASDVGEPEVGRIGPVAQSSLGDFAEMVRTTLGSPALRVSPTGSETINRVAVLPGSGGSAIDAAQRLGADVFVSGDISHHNAAAAKAAGMAVIDAGHIPSERPGMSKLVASVQDVVPSAIDLTAITTDPWEG